jgi:predicted nucleotidyltransferase
MPAATGELPALERRFTASGSEAGEERVRSDMAVLLPLLAQALPGVRAIFLVGGYGRGEGGILEGAAGPEPFNDYDLLAVFDRLGRPLRQRLGRRLRALAPELRAVAGVPVDVGIEDRRGLLAAPASVLWYEIATGHRLLWGVGDIAFPRYDPARLPLDEAILLLTNRGSSMLLREVEREEGRVAGPPSSAEVTDAMKLVLAWGDALLLRAGSYTCSYQARREDLRRLRGPSGPFPAELRALYEEAIEFKLRPAHAALEEPQAGERIARIKELHPRFQAWFEGERLGRSFRSWREYANPAVRKLRLRPPAARMLAKHLLKLGPPRDLANARLHARGTYERLISALPLLLFSDEARDWDLAARLLNARPAPGPGRWWEPARRYLRLWK